MIMKKNGVLFLLSLFIIPQLAQAQSIDVQKIQKIRLKMYMAEGLIWKNQSAQIRIGIK